MPVNRTTAFDGWRVVAAAFVVAVFGWGVGFYGPPVFLATVLHDRGWPVALVSGAVTLHFLAGAVMVSSLPRLYRRLGLAAVTCLGAVVLGVGVLGWACAQTIWQLHAAAILTGAGWPAMGPVAVNEIVGPWFRAKRPAALSMAYNGASIGGVIFSPLWIALIERVGFAAAAAIVCTVMVAVLGAVAALVLRQTPDRIAPMPDGDTRAGSRTKPQTASPIGALAADRAFVTLSVGMALALFAQVGLIAHLISVLVPDLGRQNAGFAAGLSTAAAIGGRTIVGWCMPPGVDWRLVAAASLAVQMAGCGAMIVAGHESPSVLVAGVVLIGLGIGNAISLPPLIVQAEFSAADAGRVVALIVAISQGAYAFAPSVFGLFRQTGSDHTVFAAAIAIQLAAVTAYLSGRRAFPRERWRWAPWRADR